MSHVQKGEDKPPEEKQGSMLPSSSRNPTAAPSEIDRLTQSLGATNLGPSSSGRQTTSTPSGIGAREANAPIMKKQLPYRFEKFEKRPEKSIYDSTLGRNLIVKANYFPARIASDVLINVYNIEFSMSKRPGAPPIQMKRREETRLVFWEGVRQNPYVFPRPDLFAFNGVNLLYTLDTLKPARGDITIPVKMNRLTVSMRIKYATPLKLLCEPKSVQEKSAVTTVLDEVISARIRCPFNNESRFFVQNGRITFFVADRSTNWDKRLAIPIGEGLEVWTGLHAAVKPDCQLGLLINVDIGNSIYYRQSKSLVNFLVEVIGRCAFEDKSNDEKNELVNRSLDHSGLNKSCRGMMEKALKGMSLNYMLPGPDGRSKIFKFSQIGYRAASVQELEMRDGGRITVEQYYFDIHQYRLNFPYLPCIMFNKAKKSFVPMELVFTLEEPTRFRGKIPDAPLRRMVQQTAFPAMERHDMILQMAAASGEMANHPVFLAEQDEHMRQFGVSVQREFVEARATLLPEPALEFGNKPNGEPDIVKMHHEGEWSLTHEGAMRKSRGPKKNLVPMIIFMRATVGGQDRLDLQPMATLMKTLYEFGLGIPKGKDPYGTFTFNSEVQEWEEMIGWMKEFKLRVAKEFPGAIPLVIVVFQHKCTTRRQKEAGYFNEYSMIKYIGDVYTGIYTQCLLTKTYGQLAGNALTCSTAHNVAIKILAKIGVPLYNLQREGFHKNWTRLTDREEPTLILGIDVTHPGVMDRKAGGHAALSVACVVGNIDLDCSQFEASVRVQNVGEERTVYLCHEFNKRICAFFEHTNKRPKHVIVYRDGVSESQFAEILHEEKAAFKEACQNVAIKNCLVEEYNPTFTYIVLNKRHHTRFFATKEEDTQGKAYNLKAGTMVESDITSKEMFDFFLISHAGPLGTSRPGHYHVLYDEWRPSFAFWQTITFALAYSYVRCPKSVSQPAPVLYAHLAAKRAKDYLMAHFHVNGARLSKMDDFPVICELMKYLHKHEELKGMVFV